MTFGVLCIEIEKLLSECGAKAVLLAVTKEITDSHPVLARDITRSLIINSKTQKGE